MVGAGQLIKPIGLDVDNAGNLYVADSGNGNFSNNRFDGVLATTSGTTVATLSSVEVDEKGYLYAVYDQGFTRRIYQLPVVDVPNPNGLIATNNQSYQISPASGPFYLWDAGDGPTGSTVGFSREESATDVAAELTQLIQTQRAYSSNAKVIQTVALSLADPTVLPVEISFCVLARLVDDFA